MKHTLIQSREWISFKQCKCIVFRNGWVQMHDGKFTSGLNISFCEEQFVSQLKKSTLFRKVCTSLWPSMYANETCSWTLFGKCSSHILQSGKCLKMFWFCKLFLNIFTRVKHGKRDKRALPLHSLVWTPSTVMRTVAHTQRPRESVVNEKTGWTSGQSSRWRKETFLLPLVQAMPR